MLAFRCKTLSKFTFTAITLRTSSVTACGYISGLTYMNRRQFYKLLLFSCKTVFSCVNDEKHTVYPWCRLYEHVLFARKTLSHFCSDAALVGAPAAPASDDVSSCDPCPLSALELSLPESLPGTARPTCPATCRTRQSHTS